MKYLLCFFILVGFLNINQAQNTISYGKTTQKKIVAKLSKSSKLSAQMNELKMSPKTQAEFIGVMGILGAMNVEERIFVGEMCIQCMLNSGQVTKKEYYLIKSLYDSRGTSKSAANDLRKIDKFSTPIGGGVVAALLAASDSGVTGQGFWKAVLKVVGAIVGGGGGAVGGAIVGGIGGGAAAGVGAVPGAIAGGITGGGGGAVFGAGMGETVGEAIDEYNASSNEPSGVVARPDGKDCTGFPISF